MPSIWRIKRIKKNYYLYSNSKIYFFTIPGHIAAGIKIGSKVYILDQRLPLLDPEAWLNR